MIEIITVIVFCCQLVALARSRGRSSAWALGGLVVWLLGDVAGYAIASGDPLWGMALGIPLAVCGSLLYYRFVRGLTPRWLECTSLRADNCPCPACTSVQTEYCAGQLSCNACGGYFGG